MSKRFQDPDGPPFPVNRHMGWSIGSNGLTANGQTEILKQLWRRLQSDYQSLLKEPTPDRIKNLLKRREQRGGYPDEDDI